MPSRRRSGARGQRSGIDGPVRLDALRFGGSSGTARGPPALRLLCDDDRLTPRSQAGIGPDITPGDTRRGHEDDEAVFRPESAQISPGLVTAARIGSGGRCTAPNIAWADIRAVPRDERRLRPNAAPRPEGGASTRTRRLDPNVVAREAAQSGLPTPAPRSCRSLARPPSDVRGDRSIPRRPIQPSRLPTTLVVVLVTDAG
jgi:hypothetical protein